MMYMSRGLRSVRSERFLQVKYLSQISRRGSARVQCRPGGRDARLLEERRPVGQLPWAPGRPASGPELGQFEGLDVAAGTR